MRQTLRPYAAAGVALMGAGLVAVTPVAAPLPVLPNVQSPAVRLTDAWTDVFNTASGNATTLLNNFYDAPNVGMQQMLANWSGFLQEWFNDPSSTTVTSVNGQIQDSFAAIVTGYGLQDASAATTSTVLNYTLDSVGVANGHARLFSEIPGYLPASEASEITPIINFLASPESGLIMGALGPLISPWVALGNSITDGDSFSDTLANMVGAYFNGATLNLDSLLPTVNGAGYFPEGMTMTNLDIGFGGLLSTGSVGTSTVLGDGGVGGSIFNSVGINLTGVPLISSINAPSEAIGPIGALEAWAQTIAALLGWDGAGSPLADLTLPVIPDDGGVTDMAADASNLWQELVALF